MRRFARFSVVATCRVSLRVFALGIWFGLVAVLRALPGDLDPSFNPNVTGSSSPFVANTLIQPDGKVLICGGNFDKVGGVVRVGIARTLADGSLDPGFNATPNAAAWVIGAAVLGDGGILVGGTFTTIGGKPRTNLALLNPDGTAADGFAQLAPNGSVSSINVLANGDIVIAGSFNFIGATTRSGVARLKANGTVDPTFVPGANNGWLNAAVVQPDGKVVIAGSFTSVGGVSRNNLARLETNGTLDLGFNPGTNGEIRSLNLQVDGAILIGGDFSQVTGQTRGKLARITPSGTLDGTFNPVATYSVTAIGVQTDAKIIFAEAQLSSNVGNPNRIARLHSDGTTDLTFNPVSNSTTMAMAFQTDGRPVISGRFTTVGGLTRNRCARLLNGEATQELTAPSRNRMRWLRGGCSGEAVVVTFDLSTDGGTTWQPLGEAGRIAGGWEMTGLDLPTEGRLRARARTLNGKGSGLLETTVAFAFPPPNQPPVFGGYTISTPFQTPAVVALRKVLTKASDPDGDTVSVSAVAPASVNGGAVTLQADSIRYVPANGFSGVDTFSVTLLDGRGAFTTGTVTATVGQAPSAGGSNNANPPKLDILPGGKVGISFQGIPGRSYAVQRSAGGLDDWVNLATISADASGKISFTDDNPPSGSAFYRLALP